MEKLTSFFKDKGYQVVAMPASDISIYDIAILKKRGIIRKIAETLQLKSKPITRAGKLFDFFENKNFPIPCNFDDVFIPNLHSDNSDLIKFVTDVEYTKEFLKAIKANIDFDSTYNATNKVVFNFKNVISNSTSTKKIGDYMSSGKFLGETFFEELKQNKGYIVYEILKTKSFSISLLDSNNLTLNLEAAISVLEKNPKSNFSFDKEGSSKEKLSWKNKDTSLIFAVKIANIVWHEEQKKFSTNFQLDNIEYMENKENVTENKLDYIDFAENNLKQTS